MKFETFALRALAAVAAGVLSACGGGGGSEAAPAPTPSTAAPTESPSHKLTPGEQPRCDITLYGDSIMAGAYVDGTGSGVVHTWPLRPAIVINANRPKYRVVDQSVPGQSLYVLSWDIAVRHRDTKFVVIENGVIDSWYGEPVGQRLLDMVDLIKSEGRVPILTGYARQVKKEGQFAWLTAEQVARHDEWENAVRYVAQVTGIEYAHWGEVLLYGEADIVDSVHPTQAYSIRLSEALLAAMDRAAPECM